MRSLKDVEKIVINFLLRRPDADAEEIAIVLNTPVDTIKQALRNLLADGWMKTKLTIPDRRLVSLGYGQKYLFELSLNTHMAGRKAEFPQANDPDSLSVAVYAKLKNDESFGKLVVLEPLYRVFLDRADAAFCVRCDVSHTMEQVKSFLLATPGVEGVRVKMLFLS